MSGVVFTTSWDDGHPLDVRVAEVLCRRNFNGTFYVPIRNVEGKPVLSAAELSIIDQGFEIGSHTLDHLYLKGLPPSLAGRQILAGKHALEDILGHKVDGFAYPGGQYDSVLRRRVSAAGFKYARTTENFRLDCGTDRFSVPTTLQIYPHRQITYFRNLIARGNVCLRFPVFVRVVRTSEIFTLLRQMLDLACRRQGVFHLWGHSYEVEALGLWKPLDEFLLYAADRVPPGCRLDNAGALRAKIASA